MPELADSGTERRLRGWRAAARAAAGLVLLTLTNSAQAQIAANVTLASNALYRGETISADDPAATLALSLDPICRNLAPQRRNLD